MSLDVYLTRRRWVSYDECKTFEVSDIVQYDANITHNLVQMANKAGIYEALWRPYRLVDGYDIPDGDNEAEYEFEESHTIFARDIIDALEKGLADLEARPEYFEQFNSPNGWGLYEHFVPFVRSYLEACRQYPNAIVEVSR